VDGCPDGHAKRDDLSQRTVRGRSVVLRHERAGRAGARGSGSRVRGLAPHVRLARVAEHVCLSEQRVAGNVAGLYHLCMLCRGKNER
jgi:hypothetical protein